MDYTQLNSWVQKKLQDNNDYKSSYEKERLKNIIGCIDLTTLNATDSPTSVRQFVKNGIHKLSINSLPEVAAFCVFSNFASQVKTQLVHTNIDVACVATAFPHGQADLQSKIKEVEAAVVAGADDIDVVINRGMVLDGDYEGLASEIKAFSEASSKVHLKVILEVCELSLEQVYLAAKISIENGANFIKTSTGKGSSGASLEASLVMCLAIKEHFEKTGLMIGFKAAGGISTSEGANQYWSLVENCLGEKWMNKRYFRIGASSLLKNIIADLA